MNRKYYIILLFTCLSLAGCKKYLDTKPDEALTLLSDNLNSLQLLLDNTEQMNTSYPSANLMTTDDIQVTDASWQNLYQRSIVSANAYIWQEDVFNASDRNDWSLSYVTVLNANLVLDNLDQGNNAKRAEIEKRNIKGQALFFRAFAYYQLLQEFAKPYDAQMANTDLGIVLRATSNISVPASRSTVAECYQAIIGDLLEASNLLDADQLYKSRPTKGAAYALLAKTYLLMDNYREALNMAEQSLQLNRDLLDLNDLDNQTVYPIERFNREVSFHASMSNITGVLYPNSSVSAELYALYEENDLRKSLYFNYKNESDIQFKGSYTQGYELFMGISNNEVYLLAAECYARLGEYEKGMDFLNELLIHRYKTGSFESLLAQNQQDALRIILKERRKELLFREVRWSDIRRLSKDSEHKITVRRNVLAKEYVLEPGDRRYVFTIPLKVIDLGGIEQN